MPDLNSRWLPDGRFELTLEKCVPVVLTASTYFSKTEDQRLQIIRLLAIYAGYSASVHRYTLPERPGRFVESGDEFVFENANDADKKFYRLCVPRSIVVSGERR